LNLLHRVNVLVIAVAATGMIMVAATLLAQTSHASNPGGWTYPCDVSQSGTGYTIGPDLEVDTQGNLHLIWMTGTLASKDSFYAMSTDSGGTWPTTHLIDTEDDSSNASRAVDTDGTVHLAWWDLVGVEANSWLYYVSGVGTTWDAPYALATGDDINEPVIVVANGIIHIVFSYKPTDNFDLYYKRRYVTDTNANWSLTTLISDTGSSSLHANMATDPDGNLHLAWHDQHGSLDDIVYYISGTVGPASTEWSSAIVVSNGITEATAPGIGVGSDNIVHIAFGKKISNYEQYVYYVNFPVDSPPDPVSATLVPGSQVDVSRLVPYYPSPSIALVGTTQVHLIWNGAMSGDLSDRVYYATSDDQGENWSEPVPISPGSVPWAQGFATIASDANLFHVAWQQQESLADHDIYYSRRFPVAWILPFALKTYP
jgi:hypothetical protein